MKKISFGKLQKLEFPELPYLVDYTGKLNTHDKYIKMLNLLEKETVYIEIVTVDKNKIVEKLKQDVLKMEKVNVWWCTKSADVYKLYRIKSSKELFNYLRSFETFCKYYYDDKGDKQISTDFGYDDIAFYNKNDEIMLCTCTHECFIDINQKLLKEVKI